MLIFLELTTAGLKGKLDLTGGISIAKLAIPVGQNGTSKI
jgi:hypothetical protein